MTPRTRRLLALCAAFGGPLCGLAWASSGGPDAGGLVWSDSSEADGPPHTWLDSSGGEAWVLGDESAVQLSLPFAVDWYGTPRTEAWVSDNGVLSFGGAVTAASGSCPSDGALDGVAALWMDFHGATVTTTTYGDWPTRTFVLSWEGVAPAGAPGSGRVQLWLLEGRGDVAVVLDDVDFGDATWDGGAGAVVGVGDGAGSGLGAWCGGGIGSGTTAWFGAQDTRPGREEVWTGEMGEPLYGESDFVYAGRQLAAGDLNGDGRDDLLVGDQDFGAGVVYLLYRPYTAGPLADAPASFEGSTTLDAFGAALSLGDLDGDGAAELLVGAPQNDLGGSAAGAVYGWAASGFTGVNAAADADWVGLGPARDRPAAGTSISAGADVDGDGYGDLLVGAPDDDAMATNGGSVFLVLGGTSWPADGALDTLGGSVASARAGERLGQVVRAGDLDADGLAEVVVGAPRADLDATDGGAVYVVDGGSWSGTADVDSRLRCTVSSSTASARIGEALLLADLDGSGGLDLVVGAPADDGAYRDAGQAYAWYDPGASGCEGLTTAADAALGGDAAAGDFGAALAAADLDGDGAAELLVAAPNRALGAAGGGAIYAWSAPVGSQSAGEAERRLVGGYGGGQFGDAVAVATDADSAYDTILAAAPLASYVGSGDGVVHTWQFLPDFQDDDGDGFVAAGVGGNDCDDDDASAFPGGFDADDDYVDGDCDGWIDGTIQRRDDPAGWEWDLAEIGGGDSELYDFEALTLGDRLSDYGSLSFASPVFVQGDSFGTFPAGELGGSVYPDVGNLLDLRFDADVDALALRVLDPSGTYALAAWDADGEVVSALLWDLDADDVTGGVYQGFTFVRSVRRVVIEAGEYDGFGVDDLSVAWADGTDRDLDGWSELDGDCDDADPTVSPGATEVLDDDIDNDCDGIVDAGDVTLFDDYDTWLADVGIDPQLVDFERLRVGAPVTDQYVDLGVDVSGTVWARSSVDGTTAHDGIAASPSAGGVSFAFEEDQSAVAFWALDVDGPLTVHGWLAGVEQYTAIVTPASHDAFVGLRFDFYVDTLVIDGDADVWGLDDLVYATLGLDDADGDGQTERDGDCDDSDPEVYDGAEETWYDGVDGDCAGDDDFDADADGSPAAFDCNDTDESINPDADETWYDGVDADCSGGSDYDADGDGHDDVDWGGDDCDDTDSEVSPDAEETWYDGVDQDCAGDDDYDADGDGVPVDFGGGAGGDCDDGDASVSPEEEETWYDGVDQDCSGDEESDYDADQDGYIAAAWGGDDCEDFEPTAYPGAPGEACYDGIDQDCDGADDYDCDVDGFRGEPWGGDDCDDADPAINPDAVDIPRSGVDENCDDAPEFDEDGDGYDGLDAGGLDCDDADPTVNPAAVDTCYDGVDTNCDFVDDDDCDADGHADGGHGGDDCDDADPSIHPGAPEYVYDGIDSDCDGTDDYDDDGDGQQVDWYGGTDCDDTDPAVYLGAPDDCYDGIDSDCYGNDDWDCDRDGHRPPEAGGDDCDDADSRRYPGATDTPADGIDQDCDGVDSTECTDCDGDGWTAERWGGSDCDDDDAAVHPDATERWYDGTDADCDGADDYDQDADGHRAEAWGGDDCNDADAAVSPEVSSDGCDGRDEDCDGTTDEDCVEDSGDTGDTAETGDTDTGDSDTAETGDSDTGDSDTAETGDSDTAETGDSDTADSGDSGESGADDTGADDKGGCACATGGEGGGVALAGVLLALATGARRRR